MAANDITGDSLISKIGDQDAYAKGYDAIQWDKPTESESVIIDEQKDCALQALDTRASVNPRR